MNQYQIASTATFQGRKKKKASRGRATEARFWLLAAASLLVAAASAQSGPGVCTRW
jgi:hypothetical protein